MSDPGVVVHLGLRPSALEWTAELEAAAQVGLRSVVALDGDLTGTGLPAHATVTIPDPADPGAVADTILDELADRDVRPTAVVCWTDRFVRSTAAVASRIGLRGHGTGPAAVCTDKIAQRRALDVLGLNPPWAGGTTPAHLDAALATVGTPAVFKLAHASGGLGLTPIGPLTDISRLLERTASNYISSTTFVLERRVEGSEHSVAGIVAAGAPVVLGVADKDLTHDVVMRTTTVPSALTGTDLEAVTAAATTAVGAVGLHDGGFHVDLRLTANGPIVLEVGARLGGDLINSHLIPTATAGTVKPYKTLLSLLAHGTRPDPAPVVGAAATVLLPTTEPGGGADLLTRARQHPRVRAAGPWPGTASIALVVDAGTDDPATVIADATRWLDTPVPPPVRRARTPKAGEDDPG